MTVVGASMHPGLHPGDRVLVRRGRGQLRNGDVVVLRVPAAAGQAGAAAPARGTSLPLAIKRVAALASQPVPEEVKVVTGRAAFVPAGALVVLSDNPGGTDSRRWGFLPVRDVLGRVVWRFPRYPHDRSG